ncbi:hypothetical protein [Stratiformator vulcanicus]|uniref:Uncharacterized protein n=1 Tax=Stratiformator vulcanicus TaxID=2527980 RepID=A0A517R587_9PLAN|nr:hypothetical protein [Stratiformator vulcanicus]QDT39056.1 hypothetical protein Pan189_34580 [Stratiformator vulcanicus]
MRILGAFVGLLAVAILSAQLIAAGILYARGQLTGETISEIQGAVFGSEEEDLGEEPAVHETTPSMNAVLEERAMRVLALGAKEEELRSLRDLVSKQADDVAAERERLEALKEEFRIELQKLKDERVTESIEKAQSIVSKSKTSDAVHYLMTLSIDENVQIFGGLQAKTQAKLLQEFAAGVDEVQQRGRSVFEAIALGSPEKELIDEAFDAVRPEQASAPSSADRR